MNDSNINRLGNNYSSIGKYRNNILKMYSLGFIFLFILVFIYFDSSLLPSMILYLTSNFIITIVSISLIKANNRYWSFYILVLVVFFIVYIVFWKYSWILHSKPKIFENFEFF